MTCKEVQFELDRVIDGKAPVDALFHLATCAECRACVAELRALHRHAASAPKPIAPDDLRARISAAVYGEALS